MPNYKIFQDVPDQARVKIFAGAANVAVTADTWGNVGITALGLSITAPAGGLSVTPPAGGLSVTPPANGLLITSAGLSVTAPANGLTVTAPASGLSVTPPAGGFLITSPGLAMSIGTTDVSTVRANITDTAGSGDTAYNVLNAQTWTFGVVNSSAVTNAQATVKLQISPNATTWQDDPTGIVTINQNSLATFVSQVFLKYARLYYSAVSASSAVTLNIYFQGQL